MAEHNADAAAGNACEIGLDAKRIRDIGPNAKHTRDIGPEKDETEEATTEAGDGHGQQPGRSRGGSLRSAGRGRE